MRTCRLVMIGAGNIGRCLLQILADKSTTLREQYGIDLQLVGVADSGGAVFHDSGLDYRELLSCKRGGKSVSTCPKLGVAGMSGLELLQQARADLLVELSPTNLKHGEPGLAAITWALSNGMDVVTANKGPMVLAYQYLTNLAKEQHRSLLFSATVTGGLPTINLGRRDLVGARIDRVEGIFNTTTNYILCRMGEAGLSLADALMEAQKAGVAEADPTLDIDGWDATNKLVIVANSVLHMPATLQDVSVQGIRGIDRADLVRAHERGRVIKLLATAERRKGGGYTLSVKPTELPQSHPMARLTQWQMGVVFTTDIMGVIAAVIDDEGPTATTAAVLRDILNTLLSR
jgi:homoserine dehydrogenase